jgi:Zn-dependent M28 family amino/carboxypeptidase
MCRDSNSYPPPNKTKKVYSKPVPVSIEKLKKLDGVTQAILSEVSTENIKNTLIKLSSYHTRHSKSMFINEAADWLVNTFKNMGYDDVSFHNYTENIDGKNYALKNVICKKAGFNKKCILVCAHYDSRMKNLADFQSVSPGANDNASGVSSILEIARILKKQNLDYSLVFAFFSGEEQGLLGSKHYAKYVKDNNVDIYRLINLDMIGYPKLNQGIAIVEIDNHTESSHNRITENDQDSSKFGKIMADMSSYTDLNVSLDHIWNSDYEPFEAEGYVVIGAYDGSAEQDLNPHYHDSSDTPTLIDWNYLTSVTKMVLATVFNVAKRHS